VTDQPTNDPTPRTRTPTGTRLFGLIVLAFLVIAVILLALGVVNFEQIGFFS
jgi:hypothetical protein